MTPASELLAEEYFAQTRWKWHSTLTHVFILIRNSHTRHVGCHRYTAEDAPRSSHVAVRLICYTAHGSQTDDDDYSCMFEALIPSCETATRQRSTIPSLHKCHSTIICSEFLILLSLCVSLSRMRSQSIVSSHTLPKLTMPIYVLIPLRDNTVGTESPFVLSTPSAKTEGRVKPKPVPSLLLAPERHARRHM